ncbi:MAG: ATP-binding protein [Bacillota bacterium]
MRKGNLKFTTKIFLAYGAFVILSALAFVFFFLEPEERRLAQREEETLRAVAEGLAKAVHFDRSGPLWPEDLIPLVHALGIRLTLIAPDGRVIGDSHYPAAAMENHRYRPEVRKALAGEVAVARRFSRTLRINFLYLAVPLRRDGRVVGVLRVAKAQQEIARALHRLRTAFAGGLGLASLLALGIGLLILRRLVRPLEELETAARRLGRGELGARVRVPGRDELGTLAEAFNRMAEKIQGLVANLAAEKGRLAAVLATMADGVLVFDGEQRVTLANKKAGEFLGLPTREIEGRTPAELLLPGTAKELIAKAVKEQKPVEGEFILDFPARRHLYAALAPVNEAGAGSSSILLVLRDLTALRRLERVRQDFVANVSHELRTPLAAIKLLVETLLRDGMDETRRRDFLSSIEAECDRLNALVNDLLTLAKLDEGKMPATVRVFSLPALVEEVADRLFPPGEASRRPLLSFPPDLPPAKADPEHIRQILINLLDNAVRHTPEGTAFGVEATFDADWITVTVWDKGPGIPAAERERIFERFYRLDKARSRAAGGTGLGLAIVKHLVEGYGGRVWVEEGPGARFRFTLPRA